MFKNQQANITFELASDRTNAHNSREEKPSYLMPGYYLNEKYGIMKKPVRHIRLNKFSFDDLWQKRRDEMKYEVSHLGKIKLVDKHKGKKPLKQNCHYECINLWAQYLKFCLQLLWISLGLIVAYARLVL